MNSENHRRKKDEDISLEDGLICLAGAAAVGAAAGYGVYKLTEYCNKEDEKGQTAKHQISSCDNYRKRQRARDIQSDSKDTLADIGSAVLGAFEYGLQKLSDYYDEQEEKKREFMRSSEKRETSPSLKEIEWPDDDDSSVSQLHDQSAAKSSIPVQCKRRHTRSDGRYSGSEVIQEFHKFYYEYVKIDEDEKWRVKQVVTKTMHHLNRYLNTHMSAKFPVGWMFINEVAANLLVVKPNQFTVHVPINLDHKMWELIDGGRAAEVKRGHHLIKRNLKIYGRGASPYDSYLAGRFLSPVQINLHLKKVIDQISWPMPRFRVYPDIAADYASVDVEYGSNEKVHVDFVPLISLNNHTYVADIQPKVKSSGGYENLWRESFLKKERMKLDEIRGADGGSRMQCLLTFLALQHTLPDHFGLLKKNVLKTVFYHVSESEDYWAEETLMERFIDVLKSLEEYLGVKNLPDFFNPHINVLENYSDRVMRNRKIFISKIIGSNDFKRLLIRRK